MNWLNDSGVTTNRNQKFTYNSVQTMLTNKRYIGENHFKDIVDVYKRQVDLVGVHDCREDILLTTHDLNGCFVGILIELLGELIAAVVVKVGRVDIKDKLAVMGGIRLQAAR